MEAFKPGSIIHDPLFAIRRITALTEFTMLIVSVSQWSGLLDHRAGSLHCAERFWKDIVSDEKLLGLLL